jgi:protein SCO1/2
MSSAILAALALACFAPQGLGPGALAEGVGIDQHLGERLPLEARFLDENGRELALGELVRERPLVLAFVYYRCPMLCTEVLNGLVRALKVVSFLPGHDYDVVAISIDPGETSELAAEKEAHYAALFGSSHANAAEGWHFLVGSEEAIASATRAAGFRYLRDPASGQYAHASGILVITPEGTISRYFYGVDYSPRDLRLALVEASQGKIGTLSDAFLMLCFHYDPATGRYGIAIQRIIRASGVATVVALASGILWMRRRERSRVSRGVAGTGELGGSEP